MTTLDGEFWKRVEIARSSRDSNCISVARYLLGAELCPEPAIDGYDLESALRGLEVIQSPEAGSIAAWVFQLGPTKSSIHHMAVIRSMDPIKLIQKEGHRGNFSDCIDFEEVNGWYAQRNYKTVFYKKRE